MVKDNMSDQVEGVVGVREEKKGDVLILRFLGRLDAVSTPEAEKRVMQLIEGGSHKVLMDFAGIDYISSAGMRMLLAVTKKLKVHSGRLVLCSITMNVMDVFKMSGFDHVLELTPNEGDALSKF